MQCEYIKDTAASENAINKHMPEETHDSRTI